MGFLSRLFSGDSTPRFSHPGVDHLVSEVQKCIATYEAEHGCSPHAVAIDIAVFQSFVQAGMPRHSKTLFGEVQMMPMGNIDGKNLMMKAV